MVLCIALADTARQTEPLERQLKTGDLLTRLQHVSNKGQKGLWKGFINQGGLSRVLGSWDLFGEETRVRICGAAVPALSLCGGNPHVSLFMLK